MSGKFANSNFREKSRNKKFAKIKKRVKINRSTVYKVWVYYQEHRYRLNC